MSVSMFLYSFIMLHIAFKIILKLNNILRMHISLLDFYFIYKIKIKNLIFSKLCFRRCSNFAPSQRMVYTRAENQFGRSSNEIASAVHHYLSNVVQGLNHNDAVVKFRLVSDGCGRQF